RTGNPDAVNVLLSHGANVNARESSMGQTALMWAAAEGHPAVVRMLIEHAANVNARTRFQLIADPPPPEAGLSAGGRNAVSLKAASVTPEEEQSFKTIQSTNNPDEKLPLLLSFEKQYSKSKFLPDIYQDMLQIYDQKNDIRSIRRVADKVRPLEKQLAKH